MKCIEWNNKLSHGFLSKVDSEFTDKVLSLHLHREPVEFFVPFNG